MSDGQLTPHFNRSEFACRCCGKSNPTRELVEALELLRELLGAPLRVTSGSRCVNHNARVGGARLSRHLLEHNGVRRASDAADIVPPPGVSVQELYRLALKVPAFANGGLGVYPVHGFLHCDTRGHRVRWAVLRRGGPQVKVPREYGKAAA